MTLPWYASDIPEPSRQHKAQPHGRAAMQKGRAVTKQPHDCHAAAGNVTCMISTSRGLTLRGMIQGVTIPCVTIPSVTVLRVAFPYLMPVRGRTLLGRPFVL